MYKILKDNSGRNIIITNTIPYWRVEEEWESDRRLQKATKINNFLKRYGAKKR